MDKELKIKTEEKLKDQATAANPWNRHKKKLLLLLALLLAMGGAYYYLTMKITNHMPEVKNITLEEYADEKIEIDPKAAEVDLLQSVEKRQHLFKISEKNYQLTPSKRIKYARIAFILVAAREKDLDNIEKNEAVILETLNNVLRRSRPEDFEGAAGKEAMRTRILKALNEQLTPPLLNLRYGILVLH